jgi:hypothetical protein
MTAITIHRNIGPVLQDNKYATISATQYSFIPELIESKQALWADWDDLEPDNYLKNGATFRLRRFAYFYFLPSCTDIQPLKQTHYFQASELNSYAGGIQRHLAYLKDSTLNNQFLHELINMNFKQFPLSGEMANNSWKVDIHQIRILASADEVGEPTPEGIHHDENEFVVMHLIKRHNILDGINTIYNNDKQPLESVTLNQPMDSLVVWDPHVMHGVSAIRPDNENEIAFRDILLIGYTYAPDLSRPE